MSRAKLARAKSLRKLKADLAGVKYGFAKRKYALARKAEKEAAKERQKAAAMGFMGAAKLAEKQMKAEARKAKKAMQAEAKRKREAERKAKAEARKAAKRSKAAKKAARTRKTPGYKRKSMMTPAPRFGRGMVSAKNPGKRRFRFNYSVPVYAFNQYASTMAGVQDGITAGFRPKALGRAVPVVGGLIGNSILAGTLTRIASDRFTLSDKMQEPVRIGIGLASAGALAMGTRMVAPQHAGGVFIGGLSQVLWGLYNRHVRPMLVEKFGMGCCPDLSFGQLCAACDNGGMGGMQDFLTPGQVQDARTVVSELAAPAVPAPAVATAAPPLTAKVNGKDVPVEKVGEGVGNFGDFLTPNQVGQASPIG
jgi:hypothetical protein